MSGHVRFHEELRPLLIDIGTIAAHPDNPNNGDVEAIAESIEVNGCYKPVVVQRSTGYIVAGNHTYAALLSLGSDQAPVVWLDLDDEQALRVLLSDNQIARLAMVDQGLLEPLLERLQESERGLLGTGYAELIRKPDPLPPTPKTEEGRTLDIYLAGDLLAAWEDVPGEDDLERLQFLLDLR